MRTGRILQPFLFVGALAVVCPAFAHTDTKPCSTYDSSSKSVPSSVQKYVRELPPGASAKLCVYADHSDLSLLTPVSMDRGRVCRFEELMFSPSDGGAINPGRSLRFTHMLPNVEICPPRGDERYVPTNGITDGVMLRITDFWTKLQASPLKLDTFLEGSGGANSRTPGYENFRTVLSQHASQLKMTDIRFVSAGESPTQSPAYEIFVGGVATGEATVLTVDVDDKGVGILRIDSGPH